MRGDVLGKPLSPREHEALMRYARVGLRKTVADEMGVRLQTVRSLLERAFPKLGADNIVEAFWALGWLRPDLGGPTYTYAPANAITVERIA